MKINIETKYNIGEYLYMFEKSWLKGSQYQGHIHKEQIMAIHIIDDNNNYLYETCKGLLHENQFYVKLKDLKQELNNQGYTNIKYVG